MVRVALAVGEQILKIQSWKLVDGELEEPGCRLNPSEIVPVAVHGMQTRACGKVGSVVLWA